MQGYLLSHTKLEDLNHYMPNRGMSLDEFKFIFWMEYAHRMWGRVLGLVFAVPATYFVYRGWVNGALGRRLGLLFAMGATQGFVGWWMVRSGLQVNLFTPELSEKQSVGLLLCLSTQPQEVPSCERSVVLHLVSTS